LDNLRNRELSEEENREKESLIDQINEIGAEIAHKITVYQDSSDGKKDGTIIEELVYRMDEAREIRKYSDGFYFHFLVYVKPQELQEKYDKIKKIFEIIADHDLLKEEFLGKWEYLERAREIFEELRHMYEEAYENNCGIVKTDKVEWVEFEDEELEEEEI